MLAMGTQTEVRRRVEDSISDLDDAIRLLWQAIFGLENQMAPQGLRHQILQLCAGVSPVPEITFAGPAPPGRRLPWLCLPVIAGKAGKALASGSRRAS